MSRKVSVAIEKDENGFYAYSSELEGCRSQGESFEETLQIYSHKIFHPKVVKQTTHAIQNA